MSRLTSSLRSATLGLIGALLLAMLVPGLVMAQGQPPKLGIKPIPDSAKGYFDLTLAPGATSELTVELGNYGLESAEAYTYAANVYSLVNGGMGVGLNADASGTTTWLSYTPERFTLESRKAIMRTFTVTVPPDAAPGEYLTSLVIEGQPVTTGTGGGAAISQVVRQAIAVSILVPGPRSAAITLDGIIHLSRSGKSVVSVELTNIGNVRVRPAGEFVLRDAAGNEISRYPVSLNTIYAGTSTMVEIPFAGELPIGGYNARIELSDPEAGLDPVIAELKLSVVAPTPMPTVAPVAAAPGPAALNLPTPAPGAAPLALPDVIWPLLILAVLLAALTPMLLRRRRR